jgi:hypothetical protein
MKKTSVKKLSALFLGIVLTGTMPAALRAQLATWPIQTFDGNICGLHSISDVTLAYDATQDDTGDGGGSCHVSTDYSQGGLFEFTVDNEACCFCESDVGLQLSNYDSVEFDVKWDNSSTVRLTYFNTNLGFSPGITIGLDTGEEYDPSISTVIIPSAATNGWVHVSAAIDHRLGNYVFLGLIFEKAFPAYGASNTAAFWLDNLSLAGPLAVSSVAQSCGGGNFTLHVAAIKGKTYTVLQSTNLVNWINLVSGYPANGAATNGALSFTDTNANGGQGYYRIRSP